MVWWLRKNCNGYDEFIPLVHLSCSALLDFPSFILSTYPIIKRYQVPFIYLFNYFQLIAIVLNLKWLEKISRIKCERKFISWNKQEDQCYETRYKIHGAHPLLNFQWAPIKTPTKKVYVYWKRKSKIKIILSPLLLSRKRQNWVCRYLKVIESLCWKLSSSACQGENFTYCELHSPGSWAKFCSLSFECFPCLRLNMCAPNRYRNYTIVCLPSREKLLIY